MAVTVLLKALDEAIEMHDDAVLKTVIKTVSEAHLVIRP